MRSTKIDGVTIISGSSPPVGTTSSTSTIEISRGLTIDEIAHVVGDVGFDECVIRAERLFEDATLTANDALFFPFCHVGTDADW